ncbi:hypothetical protein AVEN_106552-1 [Araneus ventricosus]|uniref:Uncharacterized protein n=1 Tax=Araneus ventricosus TaxID=182803 RepID=A0A4Y2RL07_ARAVE|nr:hypothetical protein AVEN_106552-1 [Araneus ventricosus]
MKTENERERKEKEDREKENREKKKKTEKKKEKEKKKKTEKKKIHCLHCLYNPLLMRKWMRLLIQASKTGIKTESFQYPETTTLDDFTPERGDRQ